MINETAQQYIGRLHRTLGDQKPLEVLESTLKRLEEMLDRIKDPSKQGTLPPGKWSDAQILAHFAEGEMVVGYRLRTILASSGTPIQAYDQNVWVANSGYLQRNPTLALALFSGLRKSNLELLKALSPEQWECFGIHSERGKESIADMVRLLAGHDINHLGQLRSAEK